MRFTRTTITLLNDQLNKLQLENSQVATKLYSMQDQEKIIYFPKTLSVEYGEKF